MALRLIAYSASVFLVGFWIPPAVVWAGGGRVRSSKHHSCPPRADVRWADHLRPRVVCGLVSLPAPPHAAVPGASHDPTYAPPEAVARLAVVATALVLPRSAIACVLAFRSRARSLRGTTAGRATA